MSEFFINFEKASEQDWLEKVKSELKGNKIEDVLHKHHPIEEIEYYSYGFFKNENQSFSINNIVSKNDHEAPNDWINNVLIQNDEPKKMNEFAHHYLSNGANGLKFDLASFSINDIELIVKGIDFKHVAATFTYYTKEQFNWLNNIKSGNDFSITAISEAVDNLGLIKNVKNRLIKAIDVQTAGGNTVQEIAFALYKGHETLFELIRSGLTVDDASSQIKFQFGIGSNFFFEMSKFKVFRFLWQNIIREYQPKEEKSFISYIEASTSFLNKSLKDPHTNLLRQTTEAISAILGGIDELTILPYNLLSKNKNIVKTQRLSLNIALLLKEESYLDKVASPSDGAYILDNLQSSIADKSWRIFQKLEQDGISFLEKEIHRIAQKRIELTENKTQTVIGINKFFNPDTENDEWSADYNTIFGKSLILERDCNIEK